MSGPDEAIARRAHAPSSSIPSSCLDGLTRSTTLTGSSPDAIPPARISEARHRLHYRRVTRRRSVHCKHAQAILADVMDAEGLKSGLWSHQLPVPKT